MDPETAELHKQARVFVSLERYADILAHVMYFGQGRLPELLQHIGLSQQQWAVVEAAWTHELAEGKRRQQHEQASRFNVRFSQTRQRLAKTQPALDKIHC